MKISITKILIAWFYFYEEVEVKKLIFVLIAGTYLTACSENKSTNERYEGRFAVSSNVGEVKYKITDEVVRGEGCSGGFLGIPTGDRNFIPSGVDLGTREGRAQAAAIYDALYGKESGQLGTDIIVQPTFNINTSGVPLIAKQACATVVGYRGVVTGVK